MIKFKILFKCQESLFGKVMLCITRKDCFLELKFLFCFNANTLDDSFIFIWKKILCYIFLFLCHILPLDPLAWIANLFAGNGFSINSKISLMSSGDKPKLILKISVKDYADFRYFGDFDIKIVLLVQNSFEWIAFCLVEYCLFFKPVLKL